MQKNEKKSKSCLWIVLAVLNVVGIGFPLNYYFQTDCTVIQQLKIQRRTLVSMCRCYRSYALLWPLSAFSLASLTRNAPAEIGKLIPIQVVQLQQLNCELPVLSIRCDGLIRYLGLSKPAITIAGQGWYPKVYEITASPVHKLTLWVSPEGLLLAAERPSLPDARMELVRFTKFANF